MDPVSILALFVGGVAAFFGYRLITDAIRIWGFIIGAALFVFVATNVFHLAGSLTNITLPMGIAALAGGILGAIAAGPLSIVIIFISGMALGIALGEVAFPYLSRGPENMLITTVLALFTGLLAVKFQEVVLIVTTAFLGALAVIYGARNLMSIELLPAVIAYFIIGFLGAAAQYKTEHPDSSLLGR
jgi:hypothetical protein